MFTGRKWIVVFIAVLGAMGWFGMMAVGFKRIYYKLECEPDCAGEWLPLFPLPASAGWPILAELGMICVVIVVLTLLFLSRPRPAAKIVKGNLEHLRAEHPALSNAEIRELVNEELDSEEESSPAK